MTVLQAIILISEQLRIRMCEKPWDLVESSIIRIVGHVLFIFTPFSASTCAMTTITIMVMVC